MITFLYIKVDKYVNQFFPPKTWVDIEYKSCMIFFFLIFF